VIKGLESRELELELVYVFDVILGTNHGYKVLDDHFDFVCVVLDVYLNGHNYGLH